MDTVEDICRSCHDCVDLTAQYRSNSPSRVTMASDGSLVLHIRTDSISQVLCIASQNRLLGTSTPISVHRRSRSSLRRALVATLTPSRQSYVKQKKPHDVSQLVPTSIIDRKRQQKREPTTLQQGTGNGMKPILCSETIVVGAMRVRSQGAPNDPRTCWRQKERKESLQYHHNHICNQGMIIVYNVQRW